VAVYAPLCVHPQQHPLTQPAELRFAGLTVEARGRARRYCFDTLQRLHPGQRISQQSMGMLVGLLEGLTEQVVSKAHEHAAAQKSGAPPALLLLARAPRTRVCPLRAC
jgi:hypothetical protein